MLKHVLLKVAVASFAFSIFARGGGGDFFFFLIIMSFFLVDMFRGFGVLASLLRTVMALIAGIVSGLFFMLLVVHDFTGRGALFIPAFVAAVVSEFVCSSWAKQEPSELQEKQEVQE